MFLENFKKWFFPYFCLLFRKIFSMTSFCSSELMKSASECSTGEIIISRIRFSSNEMVKSREDVTNLIRMAKIQKGITWKSVAEKVGRSKEWTTAACLGQMAMTKEQAEKVGEMFDLPESAITWLQAVPQKGTPGIPTDPTTYRLYEVRLHLICFKKLLVMRGFFFFFGFDRKIRAGTENQLKWFRCFWFHKPVGWNNCSLVPVTYLVGHLSVLFSKIFSL